MEAKANKHLQKQKRTRPEYHALPVVGVGSTSWSSVPGLCIYAGRSHVLGEVRTCLGEAGIGADE